MEHPNDPKEDVFFNTYFLAKYIDITIRGLIAFMVFGSFTYYILMGIFDLPIYFILPIIFLLSIPLSPLLSKIQVGYKVQLKYDDFLRKVTLRVKKWKN